MSGTSPVGRKEEDIMEQSRKGMCSEMYNLMKNRWKIMGMAFAYLSVV